MTISLGQQWSYQSLKFISHLTLRQVHSQDFTERKGLTSSKWNSVYQFINLEQSGENIDTFYLWETWQFWSSGDQVIIYLCKFINKCFFMALDERSFNFLFMSRYGYLKYINRPIQRR